jgi:hypothetical protein
MADLHASVAALARGLADLDDPELQASLRATLGLGTDADLGDAMARLAPQVVDAAQGDDASKRALASLPASAPAVPAAAVEAVFQSLRADGGTELLAVLGDVSRSVGDPDVDHQALLDRLYAVLPEIELAEAEAERTRIRAEVKADLDDLFADFSLPSLGEAGN